MTARNPDSAADPKNGALPPSPLLDAWTRRMTDLLGITSDAPSDKEA